jgi:hypothetical protein
VAHGDPSETPVSDISDFDENKYAVSRRVIELFFQIKSPLLRFGSSAMKAKTGGRLFVLKTMKLFEKVDRSSEINHITFSCQPSTNGVFSIFLKSLDPKPSK